MNKKLLIMSIGLLLLVAACSTTPKNCANLGQGDAYVMSKYANTALYHIEYNGQNYAFSQWSEELHNKVIQFAQSDSAYVVVNGKTTPLYVCYDGTTTADIRPILPN